MLPSIAIALGCARISSAVHPASLLAPLPFAYLVDSTHYPNNCKKMSVPTKCSKCGFEYVSRQFNFGNSINVTLSGNSETCPQPGCGGRAYLQDGNFDFVNGVIAAFRAPGMTREKVEAAKNIVQSASNGTISSEEALERLEAISNSLAIAAKQCGGRKINWEFLLTLLALIYTIWFNQKSDAAAQAALTESRTQSELAQKMLEESQEQSKSLRELTTKPVTPQLAQEQTSGLKRRGDMRRASAIERKRKKRKR